MAAVLVQNYNRKRNCFEAVQFHYFQIYTDFFRAQRSIAQVDLYFKMNQYEEDKKETASVSSQQTTKPTTEKQSTLMEISN